MFCWKVVSYFLAVCMKVFSCKKQNILSCNLTDWNVILPYPQTLRCLGNKCPNKGITDKLWDGNKYDCSMDKSRWRGREHEKKLWHKVHRFCWDCANNTKKRPTQLTCPGEGCMGVPIDRPGRQPKEIWRWLNSSVQCNYGQSFSSTIESLIYSKFLIFIIITCTSTCIIIIHWYTCTW